MRYAEAAKKFNVGRREPRGALEAAALLGKTEELQVAVLYVDSHAKHLVRERVDIRSPLEVDCTDSFRV